MQRILPRIEKFTIQHAQLIQALWTTMHNIPVHGAVIDLPVSLFFLVLCLIIALLCQGLQTELARGSEVLSHIKSVLSAHTAEVRSVNNPLTLPVFCNSFNRFARTSRLYVPTCNTNSMNLSDVLIC